MIGIDIEKIDRFKTLKKTQLKKIYTQNEIDYAFKFSEPYSHLAGMWCVKEAFIKAVKNKNIPLKTIEVLHKENGSPYINIIADLEEFLLDDNFCQIDISISHTDDIACAVVEIM